MLFLIVPVVSAVIALWLRITDRERWEQFKDRGENGIGGLPPFSRLDGLIYSSIVFYVAATVSHAILRTTEVSVQTEKNTKEMGDVIDKMRVSSELSVDVLQAMRDEADAARLETGRAQRLALWVGVGTGIIGAIVGGIAGAVAAHFFH